MYPWHMFLMFFVYYSCVLSVLLNKDLYKKKKRKDTDFLSGRGEPQHHTEMDVHNHN